MNAREFFYLVSNMRTAQNDYFRDRDRRTLARARALENEVDREIRRVKEVLETASQGGASGHSQPAG